MAVERRAVAADVDLRGAPRRHAAPGGRRRWRGRRRAGGAAGEPDRERREVPRVLQATASGDRHVGFRVRGRTFAYYLDDHHGDGRAALNCKVPPGDLEALVALDPDRFHVPAYLGARGWLGVRLDGRHVDRDEIARFVGVSYRLVAPKRLAALAGRGGRVSG